MHSQQVRPLEYEAYRNAIVGHWDAGTFTPGISSAMSLWYSATSAAITRAWLQDVRYDPVLRSLKSYATRQEEVDVEITRYCNGHTCTGCATLQLKQLCAALEMCMNTQCFGTLVNHGDILCDAGMVVESLYSQSIALYVASWNVLANVVVSNMEGSIYVDDTVHMEWASDVFYSLVCESKDVVASLTAFVATMFYGPQDQASLDDALTVSDSGAGDIAYGLEGFASLNGGAGNQRALTAAALHQLVYQFALGPLYLLFASYRWAVCQLADVVSMVSQDYLVVAIDDQTNWGPCVPAGTVEEILQASSHPLSQQKVNMIVNDAYADESGTAVDVADTFGVYTRKTSGRSTTDRMVDAYDDAVTSYNDFKRDRVSKVDPETRQVREYVRKQRDTETKQARKKAAKSNSTRKWTPLLLLHQLLDAGIAWLVGICTGIQDVLYNSDDPECRVADVAIADAVTCACGDTPAYIVQARRRETVAALWCTGILFLPRDDGTLAYVYNPFSMQELSEKLGAGMNAYLECMSSSRTLGDCRPVRVDVFDAAGISPMSVLTRCRENYAQRQWDAGQHALFDETFRPAVDYAPRPFSQARARARAWAQEHADPRFFSCVTTNRAVDFGECIDYYLAGFTDAEWGVSVGSRRETYFAYTSETDVPPAPGNPDACMLFTGPALTAGTNNTRERFQQCVEGDAPPGECTLPALAWTGDLKSRVPVGSVHRDAVARGTRRDGVVQSMHAKAKAEIARAFSVYSKDALKHIDVFFFTAEGNDRCCVSLR